MKALKNVEKTVIEQEKKLADVTYELDGIHRVSLEILLCMGESFQEYT